MKEDQHFFASVQNTTSFCDATPAYCQVSVALRENSDLMHIKKDFKCNHVFSKDMHTSPCFSFFPFLQALIVRAREMLLLEVAVECEVVHIELVRPKGRKSLSWRVSFNPGKHSLKASISNPLL